jgi:succinate dehydrogenase/fumarate reductase cytochrome b subunit
VVYLWIGARAIQGRDAFDAVLGDWQSGPYALVTEVLLFWAPLVFHATVGLKLLTSGRPSLRKAPCAGQWMYVTHRASALVALALIVYHGYRFRYEPLFGRVDRQDLFGWLCAELSATHAGVPWVAIFYLVGLAAITFHLARGLHGFCFSWGITASRRAARRAAGIFGVFGMLLYVVGASTVIYFATGSRFALSTPNLVSGPPPITCHQEANPSPAVSLAQPGSPAASGGSPPTAANAQRKPR